MHELERAPLAEGEMIIAGEDTVSGPLQEASGATNLRNYRVLIERAVNVFGDEARAARWLSTPTQDLDGNVPLRVAAADNYSLERLEPIFVRIEHGIDF